MVYASNSEEGPFFGSMNKIKLVAATYICHCFVEQVLREKNVWIYCALVSTRKQCATLSQSRYLSKQTYFPYFICEMGIEHLWFRALIKYFYLNYDDSFHSDDFPQRPNRIFKWKRSRAIKIEMKCVHTMWIIYVVHTI